MINLAGKTKADLQILEELSEADIQVVEGPRSRGEVPHTITGKLANWNFSRAWDYWIASASDLKGLPLEIATELHERKYPLVGKDNYENYGEVIRVNGDAGCPHPREWARKGKIDCYHIDTQEGLSTFARTIRDLNNIPSNINNPLHLLKLYHEISKLYSKWETDSHEENIEWLRKMPEILYGNGSVVNELIVAIRNENEVASIAKKWENSQGSNGIVQHFFKGDRITGFNYGYCSGPGDVLNRGSEIDVLLRPHYEELKEIRPNVAFSLERCLQRLEIPGQDYTGKSDGSISFRIR